MPLPIVIGAAARWAAMRAAPWVLRQGGRLLGGVASGAAVGAGINIANSVNSATANAVPILEERVTVACHGSSRSNKTRLMQLALSVAFGQVQNRGQTVLGFKLPPPGAIKIDYDMMGKSVTVMLMYKYSGLLDRVAGTLFSGESADVLFGGVNENLTGGNWNNWWFDKSGARTPLPDNGLVVGHGEPTENSPNTGKFYNPAPPTSVTEPVPGCRGTYAEQLVFAAFSAPCGGAANANVGQGQNALAIDGPTEQISGISQMTGIIKDVYSTLIGGGGGSGKFTDGGSGGDF